MIHIYRPNSDKYDYPFIEDKEIFRSICEKHHSPQNKNWVSLRIEMQEMKYRSDLTGFTPDMPVISQKALDILGKYFDCQSIEALSLQTKFGVYYYLNIVEMVDCLDYENSQIEYFPNQPNKPMWIKKYAFHLDKIRPGIFRIPFPNACVFFTEEVFLDINKYALQGLIL